MARAKKIPATIYLDPGLAKAVKIKAALVDKSISDVVSDAVVHYLSEDEIDLRAVRERRHEADIPFEKILKELKKDGLI